jgi:hypothetical protein
MAVSIKATTDAIIRSFSAKANRNDGERERLTAQAIKVLERHVAA